MPRLRVTVASLVACLGLVAAVALANPDELNPWVQALIPLIAALLITLADRDYFYGARHRGR